MINLNVIPQKKPDLCRIKADYAQHKIFSILYVQTIIGAGYAISSTTKNDNFDKNSLHKNVWQK